MYIGLHEKYLLFLSDFNEKWLFSKIFQKIIKYKISWKSSQLEPSCSTQTDKTKLIAAFGNFAQAPKKRKMPDEPSSRAPFL